jgi:hypothetical protein
VEEGEALGETGIMARGSGLPRHKPYVLEDVGGVTGVSNVGRPEFGDMAWVDFGGGGFCGFNDDSCGFGSNFGFSGSLGECDTAAVPECGVDMELLTVGPASAAFFSSSFTLLGLHTTSETIPSVFFSKDAAES